MRHVENSVFNQMFFSQNVKETEVEKWSCQHVSSLYYVSGNNNKYLPKNEVFFSTI